MTPITSPRPTLRSWAAAFGFSLEAKQTTIAQASSKSQRGSQTVGRRHLMAIAVLAIATCMTPPANAQGGSDRRDATTVRFGIIPSGVMGAYQIAKDRGLFEKEGIVLQETDMRLASDVVTAIFGGSIDIGATNSITILNALDKGLQLRAIGSLYWTNKSDVTISVRDNSSIKTALDLQGKTIAVPAVKNITQLAVQSMVKKAGGDPSTIKFQAMPFSAMVPTLKRGGVDAATLIEPFITTAGEGVRTAFDSSYIRGLGGNPTNVSWYITSAEFADKNPEAIRGFMRAIWKASEIAMSDELALRAAIGKQTGLAPDITRNLNLSQFLPDLGVESLQKQADVALEFGYFSKAPDLKVLFKSAPRPGN